MRSLRDSGGCWPSPEQELLLSAALLPGQQALQAWRRWLERIDLDDIDPASMRLLPQVHCNLAGVAAETGASGLDLGRLRGVHRRTWYRNQLLAASARNVLEAMQQAGLAPVLMKGSALALTVYENLGARPMADIDVLVRPGGALEAGQLLADHGFLPQYRFDAARVRTLNAVGFVTAPYTASQAAIAASAASTTEEGKAAPATAAVGALDLHWHLLPEPCDDAFDNDVHARAVPALLQDRPVLVLDPTDELLLACAHGVRWNPIPPFRWVADAHLLITRTKGTIAWPRLVETARRHGLVLPVLAALRYLATTLATPVPDAVLIELEAARPSASERIEYLLRVSATADRLVGNFPAYWLRWMRQSRGTPALARIAGFPMFLSDCWGCSDLGEMRRFAAERVRRRLRLAPALLAGSAPPREADDLTKARSAAR